VKFVLFCHSLVSDWNHGNAHFLRGIVAELLARGHAVEVYEPAQGWSRTQLVAGHGRAPLEAFAKRFPELRSHEYDADSIDLDAVLDGADVVIVHEWNEPGLVARIARHAPRGCLRLFHDTHHRSVTAPEEMARYDLRGYHGVLAFGEAVREQYLRHGWSQQVWTWHEAADTRVFMPLPDRPREGDLIWIGNWGDEERSAELAEYLIEPVQALGLKARVHGVRYPAPAQARLARAGIDYRGWLPNHEAPEAFARFAMTVHVPRRPYAKALPGVPTIRMFEALACGIPLVSAPWSDSESLFSPGADYLTADSGMQMQRQLRTLREDHEMASELAAHGRRTVLARHTCAHRVDELLSIITALGNPAEAQRSYHYA
jgi:spore maturation protein CgeB